MAKKGSEVNGRRSLSQSQAMAGQSALDRLFGKPNNNELKPTQVEISELQTAKLDLTGLDEAGRLDKFERLSLIFQHTNRFKTTSIEVKKLSGEMLRDLLTVRARSAVQEKEIAKLKEDLNAKAADQSNGSDETIVSELERKIGELENDLQLARAENQPLTMVNGMDDATLIRGLRKELNQAMDTIKDQRKTLKEQTEMLEMLEKKCESAEKNLEEQKSTEKELNWQLEQKNHMLREAEKELAKLKRERTDREANSNERVDPSKAQTAQSDQQQESSREDWPALRSNSEIPQNSRHIGAWSQHQTTNLTRKPLEKVASRTANHSQLNNNPNPQSWLRENVPIRERPPEKANGDRPGIRNQRKSAAKEYIIAVDTRPTSLFRRDEALPKVKEVLRPCRTASITDVYQNKNGKVIIKFKDQEDSSKIMEELKKIEDDFEFWKVGEKRRLIIKRIHRSLNKAQIQAELAENEIDVGLDQLHILSGGEFHYQRAIITLNESDAKQLLQKTDHVKIAWKACPIEPHIKPLQCFVCGGFNHSGYRHGRLVCQNERKCLSCAEKKTENHTCKTNPNGSDRVKCTNCGSTEHPASDKLCPIYQSILQDLQAQW